MFKFFKKQNKKKWEEMIFLIEDYLEGVFKTNDTLDFVALISIGVLYNGALTFVLYIESEDGIKNDNLIKVVYEDGRDDNMYIYHPNQKEVKEILKITKGYEN